MNKLIKDETFAWAVVKEKDNPDKKIGTIHIKNKYLKSIRPSVLAIFNNYNEAVKVADASVHDTKVFRVNIKPSNFGGRETENEPDA